MSPIGHTSCRLSFILNLGLIFLCCLLQFRIVLNKQIKTELLCCQVDASVAHMVGPAKAENINPKPKLIYLQLFTHWKQNAFSVWTVVAG